ncbi:hypothetical protein FQN60_007715 [Etheostoma spectabile]|uniref:Uncharacterized protein n=1 Tax=Etheostoma spectabile TaxID=54343 RepID=A0A5J5D033_9PERO|nr:hypothetical protein FQN60_007715 [Etheostoma spectabile]
MVSVSIDDEGVTVAAQRRRPTLTPPPPPELPSSPSSSSSQPFHLPPPLWTCPALTPPPAPHLLLVPLFLLLLFLPPLLLLPGGLELASHVALHDPTQFGVQGMPHLSWAPAASAVELPLQDVTRRELQQYKHGSARLFQNFGNSYHCQRMISLAIR